MDFTTLPSKPTAPIAYKLTLSSHQHAPLVVFINGLGLPAASWNPTIALLSPAIPPHILTYDRFGQGATTARDPTDLQPGKDPSYGHDLTSAVSDLHELLAVVASDLLASVPLVFAAASIGVHIARLYAARYEGAVSGLLFLDSNVGNREFTYFWPDPHASDFKREEVVGADCTFERFMEAYVKLGRMFDSDVKNGEGLDRRNVKTLLPSPSSPTLKGPGGKGPWLVVAGHDPKYFAVDALEKLGVPLSLTERYIQPPWEAYNKELLELSERSAGVFLAPNTSHFIQKDNPEFVAIQLASMLQSIQN